ncbi:MAG: efflux RND transporter periplasmic adaptor subunit [Cyclobacteriaceae bacterium]|nr:efflux RND transporter periplasmic adaptor subunit [Cyclobacteriaceae bacterium]
MAKKKKSNKALYISGAVLLAVILFLVVGKQAGWIGKTKPKEVEIGKAEMRTITERVSASGMIQPVTEVKISPDVAGEIIELHVEEGDSVVRDQLLLKIRPDIYQSALERARANLNQQRANLAEAKARLARAEAQFIRAELEYNRQKQLREENVISDADFELAEANFKVAKNDLESAKQSVLAGEYIVQSSQATVNEANENLRFTTITAPVSGIVSKLSVELGERVVGTSQMAGTEMMRIADLTKMEARVDVNENDIIRVKLGDSVEIDVDSYSHTGRKFKGLVTQIANTAKDKVSADVITEFQVRIRLLNESYEDLLSEGRVSPFRPGMTASVDIFTNTKTNVLTVPLAAVTTRKPDDKKADDKKKEAEAEAESNLTSSSEKNKDLEVVFSVEDGKAIMMPVKTGLSDFEYIEILEGLEAGQQIITGPFNMVSRLLQNEDEIKNVNESKSKKK